jgi:hypothetical protein
MLAKVLSVFVALPPHPDALSPLSKVVKPKMESNSYAKPEIRLVSATNAFLSVERVRMMSAPPAANTFKYFHNHPFHAATANAIDSNAPIAHHFTRRRLLSCAANCASIFLLPGVGRV